MYVFASLKTHTLNSLIVFKLEKMVKYVPNIYLKIQINTKVFLCTNTELMLANLTSMPFSLYFFLSDIIKHVFIVPVNTIN